MYVYEMNDIMFFIKSYKQQLSHFNITEYVQFSTSNTRFGASEKWFIIDVPPTLLRTFTFIVYHVSGTHYQK